MQAMRMRLVIDMDNPGIRCDYRVPLAMEAHRICLEHFCRHTTRYPNRMLKNSIRTIPYFKACPFYLLAQINIFEVAALVILIEAADTREQITPNCQRRASRPTHTLSDIYSAIICGPAKKAMERAFIAVIQSAAGLNRIVARSIRLHYRRDQFRPDDSHFRIIEHDH